MPGQPFGPIAQLLGQFIYFINLVLVPALFALAFIVFLWGVYLYFFNTGDKPADERKKGRNFIIYGIVGFFVMVSVWGLVGLLVNSFGLNPGNNRGTPMFIPPGAGVGGGNPFQNQGGSSVQGNVPPGGVCQKDSDCANGRACVPNPTTGGKTCSR
jgi:hypothetical protein